MGQDLVTLSFPLFPRCLQNLDFGQVLSLPSPPLSLRGRLPDQGRAALCRTPTPVWPSLLLGGDWPRASTQGVWCEVPLLCQAVLLP